MTEASTPPETSPTGDTAGALVEAGPISTWLLENGFSHEIMVPDHLGIMMAKQLRQQMLDFGFMSNDQITLLAVTTRVVEGNEVVGIYMNQQRRFPLSGSSFAQRAVRDSLVGIRIEHETVARR